MNVADVFENFYSGQKLQCAKTLIFIGNGKGWLKKSRNNKLVLTSLSHFLPIPHPTLPKNVLIPYIFQFLFYFCYDTSSYI